MKTAKFKSLGDIQTMAVPCAFATETSRTVEMVFRRLTSPVWANGAPIGNTNAAKNHVKQTDTPEFKAWFGKSKVVDADGKPLVVYHGTARKFDEFSKGADPLYWKDEPGFSFTSSKSDAKDYSENASELEYNAKYRGQSDLKRGIPEVKEVFLSLKNPYEETEVGNAAG